MLSLLPGRAAATGHRPRSRLDALTSRIVISESRFPEGNVTQKLSVAGGAPIVHLRVEVPERNVHSKPSLDWGGAPLEGDRPHVFRTRLPETKRSGQGTDLERATHRSRLRYGAWACSILEVPDTAPTARRRSLAARGR